MKVKHIPIKFDDDKDDVAIISVMYDDTDDILTIIDCDVSFYIKARIICYYHCYSENEYKDVIELELVKVLNKEKEIGDF